MGLIAPTLPDVDIEQWRTLPRAARTQVLMKHWAVYGFGTPKAIYLLYIVKIGLYILGGLLWVAATPGIGGLDEFGEWWTAPVVFQKVIVWTLLFEVLGFGCGFGPLTMRFLPPVGALMYWLRPGTIRLPPWPDRIPGTAGSRRSILDVALYAGVVGSALFVLISPADRAPSMIEAWRFIPLLVVLPILGLRDKTIFLAARAEHYWLTAIVLTFGFVDMILAAKLIMMLLWWGAATSKVNRHFPFVVSTMISNAPLYPVAIKRRLWRDADNDLRPSRLAALMAHGGTVIEYSVPLMLLLSTGGTFTTVLVVFMVAFHLHILSAIPMGVPLEWNVMMMFGTVYLFGHYADIGMADARNPTLVYGLVALVVAMVVWGNLKPAQVSFLPAMRYYAGNWPTSVWLFADGAEQMYADRVPKAAQLPHRQLARLYPPETVDLMIGKLQAWRGLHTHGRAMAGLHAHAADNHESRFIMDGEMVAGSAIGYNFGDGHLHHEALVEAVQQHCSYAPGDLRVIMMESQPFAHPVQRYRIVDAATGVIETGEVDVAEMVSRQPWDGSVPIRVTWRSADD